jgi:hypothetical protein
VRLVQGRIAELRDICSDQYALDASWGTRQQPASPASMRRPTNNVLNPMIRPPPGTGPQLNGRTPIDLFCAPQLLNTETAVNMQNGGCVRSQCRDPSYEA